MSLWVVVSRIRALFTARQLDDDFDREVTAHLEMLTEDYVRRGMPPDEARRTARVRFGGRMQITEQQREDRSVPFVDAARQDLRYALRVLRRSPAFTLAAVATLAIGIGASTAMFTVARGVLMRPLPYAEPDRLVRIFEENPLKRWTRNVVAPANWADWKTRNTVFSEVAAYEGFIDTGNGSAANMFLTGFGEPQGVRALSVSGNLLRMLGVPPLIGRTFTDEETFEGKSQVAVLSYGFWQSLFAGDPQVLGRTITLSGRTYDVVGVMPSTFFFPGRDVQLWVPLGYSQALIARSRRPHWLSVVAQRRPGVSLPRAREEMTAIAKQLEQQYPDTNTQMGVSLEEFHDSLASSQRPALVMLLGAVGVLFLIVCANIANLQLGRAAGRTREMTIRHALGAGRRRLVRQLLTEALVLSVLGGGLGLLLAAFARTLLFRLAPDTVPVFADVRLDRTVLLFNVALSALAPIVFGLIPALASSRSDRLNERRESSSVRRPMRNLLVACEVGLSVVLVVGAMLLVRSLVRLQQVDPGFDEQQVVTFRISLPQARYKNEMERLPAFEAIDRRVREIPGVRASGASSTLALRGFAWTGDATVEGRDPNDYERELRHESVTPDYFRAMRVRLLGGRWLDEHDRREQPPVTLVNETLARKYFRGAEAIGKRLKFGRPQDTGPWVTIVGVVADQKQDGMDKPVEPEVYVPLAQKGQNPMTFVMRTSGDPESAIAAARRAVRDVDKDVALTAVSTMTDVVQASMGDHRFRTLLLSGFAVVALLLAAIGIYGVLAYVVTQRSRELGVRLALGARPRALFAMVVAQGLRPVIAGSVVGLVAAAAVTSLMKTLLFGVEPVDPPTYVFTAATLAAVAIAACALPALRATRVDPLVALREE